MTEKLLLIDGSSLLFRGFYALPILQDSEGNYTNGVLGMATMLTNFIEHTQPTKICVAFDKSRTTFRTEMFADYKATRGATPDELKGQFALSMQMLDAMNIYHLELDGFEADDIIGTFSVMASQSNIKTLVLTGDKDQLQLIDENVNVVLTKKGITDTIKYDIEAMNERYGLTPAEFVELKALMGDKSDNIPGVKGIGEKTALKLLHEYKTLDNIYANIDSVTPAGVQKKLIVDKELAFLSKELSKIKCDLEDLKLEDCKFDGFDIMSLREFYKKHDFRRLLASLPEMTEVVIDEGFTLQEEILDLSYEAPKFELVTITTSWENLIAELGDKTEVYCYIDYLKTTPAFIGISNGEKNFKFNFSNIEAGRDFFENENIKKNFWASKEAIRLFSEYGIDLQGINSDISLMAYLLNPIAKDYDILEIISGYSLGDLEEGTAEKAYALSLVKEHLLSSLASEGLLDIYTDIEFPLTFILAKMEIEGISVDDAALREIDAKLQAREDILSSEILELTGEKFNINSPKQLGDILFNKLGLPATKKTKTGYSTNSDVLEDLKDKHPVIDRILEYRSIAKLRSTYALGLQGIINSDGKIHTTFNQKVTATGRLSSTEPNLQNIPVREELGRELRRAFVAPAGSLLLAADYSQVELRVLAHISNDSLMISAFNQNLDIHSATASEVFAMPIDEVTGEYRTRAKAVNFGIVYGISSFGLAKDLGIGRAEAKDYIEMYLERYEGVNQYMKTIVEQAKEDGYVSTLLGRKRVLKDINSRNFNIRSFNERMALNSPIQGTAADIIKLAMLRVDDALKEKGLQSKMLLQVHDELILEVPESEIDEVVTLMKEEMAGAYNLAVPLVVDVKYGANWFAMKKVVD